MFINDKVTSACICTTHLDAGRPVAEDGRGPPVVDGLAAPVAGRCSSAAAAMAACASILLLDGREVALWGVAISQKRKERERERERERVCVW